jgi:hypothetical protein
MSQGDGQKRKRNRLITALQKSLLHLVCLPSLPIVDAVSDSEQRHRPLQSRDLVRISMIECGSDNGD